MCAGINLPGEQLVGSQLPGVSARKERAYLSNVCVAKPVRRLVTPAPHRVSILTGDLMLWKQQSCSLLTPVVYAGLCAAPHQRCNQREPEGLYTVAVRACCSRECCCCTFVCGAVWFHARAGRDGGSGAPFESAQADAVLPTTALSVLQPCNGTRELFWSP